MKIFPVPFSIANEVVKRAQNDNRRLIESPRIGGNDLFYLGTTMQFIDKIQNPLRQRLIEVRDLCEVNFNNPNIKPRTIQRTQGIIVHHKISKELLLSLLPFLDSYLQQFGNLYHHVNLNAIELVDRIIKIQDEFVRFKSDLVFIRDSNLAKPYFKWFNYPDTKDNFKIVQEFFIPHQSFLNFELDNYVDGVVNTTWVLSYTMSVIYTSDNIEAVVSKAIEKFPINYDQIETIREAITKIRIGQSQFRNDLLNSERNNCFVTGISNPDLLIASHIKPWKDSNNQERLDPNNGILLTPTFDKLFDKFLITFNENGNIIWSHNRLDEDTRNRLIQAHSNIAELSIIINNNNQTYIEYHRSVFNQKEEANQA
ncbi:MAG TPA: HNH endonuclease signature motif containing protein [Bacteroidales bacterium]|nr:HNH endonuclease signature motif containing protein [Bacteroidales bacterium]